MAKVLKNLSPTSYEHPFDKAALRHLQRIPGLSSVTEFVLNWSFVRWHVIELKGSAFKVTHQSCPDLHRLIKEVEETLDITDRPDVYTQWGYNINGYTTGNKGNTLMVLNSGAVDLLTPAQLKYVVGHEMGHIKSNHVLYHTMAKFFPMIMDMIPGASFASMPLQLGLMYWNRMSEFTADRAGLLACQDKDAAISAIIKMAGLPMKYFNNINEDTFLQQAEEFERMNSEFLSGTMQNLSILTSSHPWTVYRAAELIKWIRSGEYDRLISSTVSSTKKCNACGTVVNINATTCPVCQNDDFESI